MPALATEHGKTYDANMSSEHVQSMTGRRLQTEEKIIFAAADLFLELGFKKTTVRAIAKRAEVSVGRVMSAGDKDILLVKCYDRWIGQLQAGTCTPTRPASAKTRRMSATASAATNPATNPVPGAPGTPAIGTSGAGSRRAAPNAHPTSAVQGHLVGIFLPFLEFFASHEDLSRDYAAALMRAHNKPQVFETLADDLQGQLSSSLISIGISEAYSLASAAALYDSYLGILFRWAASDMTLDDATEALSRTVAFHTQLRRPV